jgi:hypothetical protein
MIPLGRHQRRFSSLSTGQQATVDALNAWHRSLGNQSPCLVVTGVSGTGKSEMLGRVQKGCKVQGNNSVSFIHEEFVPKVPQQSRMVLSYPMGRELPADFSAKLQEIHHRGFSKEELRQRVEWPGHLNRDMIDLISERVTNFALGSIGLAYSLMKPLRTTQSSEVKPLLNSELYAFLVSGILPFLPSDSRRWLATIEKHSPQGVNPALCVQILEQLAPAREAMIERASNVKLEGLSRPAQLQAQSLIAATSFEPRIVITSTMSVAPKLWSKVCGEVNQKILELVSAGVIAARVPKKTGLAYIMPEGSSTENPYRWWSKASQHEVEYMLSSAATHVAQQRMDVVRQKGPHAGMIQFYSYDHVTSPSNILQMAVVEEALQREGISYQKLAPYLGDKSDSTLLDPHAIYQYDAHSHCIELDKIL